MEYFANKTVLITGAAGFLGSHLADAILQAGGFVIGVDNLSTGSLNNIKHLEHTAAFTFIQADVTKSPLSYLPKDKKIDCILHFASPASPPKYQAKPVETYLVNSVATHNLLQYLKETSSEGRFVFASTSEIYGDPLEHPQKETYWGNVNPNGLRSCYDESKRLGETICGVHERSFGMDVRIVRIFNTFGPRMDINDGRVIPSFIKDALNNKTVTVHGDGSQTRSYCYVSDLVNGILLLASSENLKGQTVNLGNPIELSILETAQAIWQHVHADNSTPQFEFRPLPEDDPRQRKPDVSKAQEILGWVPTTEFKEGLQQTVDYFKNQAATTA